MALETSTYIDALVTSNPDGGDARNTADDHIRLVKAALKRSFPMIAGAVSASAQAVTYVNDLNAPIQNQLNELRDGSATANNAVNARYANSASVAANIGTIPAARVADIAAANVFTAGQFIKFTTPYLMLDDDGSPADMARWQLKAYTTAGLGALRLASVDDAGVTDYAVFDAYKSSAGATPYLVFGARPRSSGGDLYLHDGDAVDAATVGGVALAGLGQLGVAQSWSKGQAITQVDLSGTSFTPNCDDSTMFRCILLGDSTINAPTSPRSGMVISLHLIQDGGVRTATWAGEYQFPGGTLPTLSTAGGARDVFAFQYDSTSGLWCAAGLNVTR